MTERGDFYELSSLVSRQAEVLEKIADRPSVSITQAEDIEGLKLVLKQVDLLIDFTLGDINILAAALDSLASRVEGGEGISSVAKSIQGSVENTRGLLDETFGRSTLPGATDD